MDIFDMHVHIFPDRVAEHVPREQDPMRAVPTEDLLHPVQARVT